MSFLDDKQEIIKLELTTYGRYLLSKGKLKPVYYAFFDDDIIYDSEFMELSESQNSIQTRILEETPSIKPQTTFTGIEKNVFKNKNLVLSELDEFKKEEQQNDSDKNYALSLPIGTTSQLSKYAPAWSINLLNGSISSSSEYIDNSEGYSGSLQPFMKIPQLFLDDTYINYEIKKNDSSGSQGYTRIASKKIGSDTYYVFLQDSEILLDIKELNAIDDKENFSVEIFMESISKDGVETIREWKSLGFPKPTEEIVNGILLDTPKTYNYEEDIMSVNYYFNSTADLEIELTPEQLLAIGSSASPFTGAPIRIEEITENIYQVQVQPEDGPFGEDC